MEIFNHSFKEMLSLRKNINTNLYHRITEGGNKKGTPSVFMAIQLKQSLMKKHGLIYFY